MTTKAITYTAAPVAARLAQLVAPQNAFARPVAAVGIWFVAITIGLLMLLTLLKLRFKLMLTMLMLVEFQRNQQ